MLKLRINVRKDLRQKEINKLAHITQLKKINRTIDIITV